MGLPRRHSRLVHLDGVAYRWVATPHWRFDVHEDGSPWRRTMAFADLCIERRVRPAAQTRVRLYADWLCDWGRDPQDRRCIDPPMVRRVVRLSILRGWDAQQEGRPFWLPLADARHLQTPRHLLYAAPIIARVSVRSIHAESPSLTVAEVRVMERMRGAAPKALRVQVEQPADWIPGDALAFLYPDDTEDGLYRCCPWFGGLFRISNGSVLLYDDSGEERLWGFRPLQAVRDEILQVQQPLEIPVDFQDVDIEE